MCLKKAHCHGKVMCADLVFGFLRSTSFLKKSPQMLIYCIQLEMEICNRLSIFFLYLSIITITIPYVQYDYDTVIYNLLGVFAQNSGYRLSSIDQIFNCPVHITGQIFFIQAWAVRFLLHFQKVKEIPIDQKLSIIILK